VGVDGLCSDGAEPLFIVVYDYKGIDEQRMAEIKTLEMEAEISNTPKSDTDNKKTTDTTLDRYHYTSWIRFLHRNRVIHRSV